MTEPYRPHGVLCALATPLEENGLTVSPPGLRRLVNFVLAGGVTGVVVLGGTGEYTTLSFRERERAVATAVECVGGRVPVVAGVLSPGIGDALQMAKLAQAHGATALMVLTPYYSQGSDDGLVEWFRVLTDQVDLPVILYNIPYRTGTNLVPHVIGRILDVCPTVVGIKECSQNIGQVTQLLHEFSERLSILCGEEYLVIPELALGAAGAVLASANIAPREWVRIMEAVSAGRLAEAREHYRRLFPLLRLLFSETNPGPLKEALALMGLPAGPPGLPLTRPAANVRTQLEHALRTLDLPSATANP